MSASSSSDILARFEKLVRRRAVSSDLAWRMESGEGFLRALGPSPSPFDNSLCWAHTDEENVEAVIAAQMAYFRSLGRAFMWKVYTQDSPSDLETRLLRAGFEVQAHVTLVVLDTARSQPATALPPGVEIRRVDDATGLAAAMKVQEVVWSQDCQWLHDALKEELRTQPDTLSIFVGWSEGRPVCSSWIRIEEGAPFASLWGGSVLPDFRGRGFYRAMVAARAEVARQRDIAHLYVEAGDMSRPILERLGFQALSQVAKCIYRPPGVA
ncbi:GNAT family N-acetyltransferase [Myxococcus xanthus]|uniref:GNAT family N-acetyltransferase n=1 Tax=Myxococcus xanthus TaxID=34 RepID=UPI0019179DF3|nr:GNAT family N-acetyltransferase [Myxococcus xanthus]QQR48285.1 GNAT family N-acetyltransferase [Myxococcus xanthus]